MSSSALGNVIARVDISPPLACWFGHTRAALEFCERGFWHETAEQRIAYPWFDVASLVAADAFRADGATAQAAGSVWELSLCGPNDDAPRTFSLPRRTAAREGRALAAIVVERAALVWIAVGATGLPLAMRATEAERLVGSGAARYLDRPASRRPALVELRDGNTQVADLRRASADAFTSGSVFETLRAEHAALGAPECVVWVLPIAALQTASSTALVMGLTAACPASAKMRIAFLEGGAPPGFVRLLEDLGFSAFALGPDEPLPLVIARTSAGTWLRGVRSTAKPIRGAARA